MSLLYRISILVLCAVLITGCSTTNTFRAEKKCFYDALSTISEQEFDTKLHSPEKLLFAVNWNKNDSEVRIALMPRSVFPQYLSIQKSGTFRGYSHQNDFLVSFYGDPILDTNLIMGKDSISFLLPYKRELVDNNQVPPPPFLVEPTVYIYKISGKCPVLFSKGVEYNLFD